MASHFRLLKYTIWSAAATTSTNTITSAVIQALMLDNVGIQLHLTGTSNGTFTVQVSNDYSQDAEGNVLNAGHWVNLTATQTIASGSPADIYFDLNQLSTPWIRVSYTNTSGTGTVTGVASGKGLI